MANDGYSTYNKIIIEAKIEGSNEYVLVGDKKFKVLPSLKDKLCDCTNMKWYVEELEYMAKRVLVDRTENNEGFFEEI